MAPAPPAPPAEPRTWDIVATVVLLVLLVLGGLVTSFMGLFLVMASDSCGVEDCNEGGIVLGTAIAVAAPWVAIVAMGVWAVVRLVRRKLAWWVAMLAIPLWGLLFSLGVAVAFSSAG